MKIKYSCKCNSYANGDLMPQNHLGSLTLYSTFMGGVLSLFCHSELHNIVFKHPAALIYYLFHTIYFRLQCNLLSVPLLFTTCFGCIWPSSGVYYFAKIVTLLFLFMVCQNVHISCKCDTSQFKINLPLSVKINKTS
jgi:hypothetical protein